MTVEGETGDFPKAEFGKTPGLIVVEERLTGIIVRRTRVQYPHICERIHANETACQAVLSQEAGSSSSSNQAVKAPGALCGAP